MPIATTKGSVSNKTYVVAGKTLQDIWKDIEKKGPKIGGKNVAAMTETPVEIKIDKLDKSEAEAKPGVFQAEVTMGKGSVIYSGTILVPKLKSDKDLSKAAKVEWKRFMVKLAAHEQEHITTAKSVADKMAKILNSMSGAAEEDSKDKAAKIAEKRLKDTYFKTFSAKSISTTITKAHQALDKATKHGAKHGAVLNLSIK